MEEDTETLAEFNLKFGSYREANIVKLAIEVDPEPSRSNTKKSFAVKDQFLHVKIRSPDIRELRIAVNSFMDHLHLANQTINRFGPPLPPTKKICANHKIEL